MSFGGPPEQESIEYTYPKITTVDFGSPGNTLTNNVRKMAAVFIQAKGIENKSKALDQSSESLKVYLPAPFAKNIPGILKVGQSYRTSYYDETQYTLSNGLSEPASPYFVTVEDISSRQSTNSDSSFDFEVEYSSPDYDPPLARGLVGWLTSILDKRPFLGLDVAAENLSYSLLKLLRDIKRSDSSISSQEIIDAKSNIVDSEMDREEFHFRPNPVNTPDEDLSDRDLNYLLRQAELFDASKQELLQEHDGYFVLFHEGKVLKRDLNKKKLLSFAYEKYGSNPFFIEFVGNSLEQEEGEEPTIYTTFG